MDKLTLIFSDIEAGSGTNTDDLVEEDLLCQVIRNNFAYAKKYPTDLVLNGDIFDFMKSPYKKEYPRHITEPISLWKLEKIAKAHPLFLGVLKEFLKVNKRTRIVFVYGNHDFDLMFPKVKEEILNLIVGKDKKLRERIIFPGFEFSDDLLLVEHGSQLDEFFSVDPENFLFNIEGYFIGEPFLKLPWGYNALYDYYIYLKEKLPLLERLFPKKMLLNLLPFEARMSMIWGTVWYMFKSFFYTQVKNWNDVLYRFHIKDFYKYFKHFTKREFHVVVRRRAKKKLREIDQELLSVGHNHKPGMIKVGKKTLLNTGTWRDEYYYNWRNQMFEPMDKSYGFVVHNKNKIEEMKLIYVPSEQEDIPRFRLNEWFKKTKN
ncbi:hypothetical protein HON03_02695 [archaeon]|nr:hypothetical protein [archaeon]